MGPEFRELCPLTEKSKEPVCFVQICFVERNTISHNVSVLLDSPTAMKKEKGVYRDIKAIKQTNSIGIIEGERGDDRRKRGGLCAPWSIPERKKMVKADLEKNVNLL